MALNNKKKNTRIAAWNMEVIKGAENLVRSQRKRQPPRKLKIFVFLLWRKTIQQRLFV